MFADEGHGRVGSAVASHVGRGARLRRCIIAKGVRILEGEVIGEDPDSDRERFTVSDGGVVVVSREHYGQRDEFDI